MDGLFRRYPRPGSGFGAHTRTSSRDAPLWVPREVMLPSMTSPSFSSRPQCAPFPAGEPVNTRSPGNSGMFQDAWDTSWATLKIMSAVDSCCITCPLSLSVTVSCCGSEMNFEGTSSGPVGKNPGAFLARYQSEPMAVMSLRKTRSRVVMLLTMV